jgi:CheY-like chemotaxis protein
MTHRFSGWSRECLRPKTVQILIAPRPSKALEICANVPVDLLISDIGMPDLDGQARGKGAQNAATHIHPFDLRAVQRGRERKTEATEVSSIQKTVLPFGSADRFEGIAAGA